MALADLSSPRAIQQAIDEYDRLGQTAFLTKYGFGKSYRFALVHEGRNYDSKAILGAAHGYEFPAKGPLGPHEFSGGRETLKKLAELGFSAKRLDAEPFSAPTSTGRLTQADFALLSRLRVSRPFDQLSQADKAAARDLRYRVRDWAGLLASSLKPAQPLQPFVSNLNPNGRTSKDYWGCVYPKASVNKSFAFQLGLIVAVDHVELCFCRGAGTAQIKEAEVGALAEKQLTSAVARMAEVSREPWVRTLIDSALGRGFELRDAWRRGLGAPRVASIDEWLRLAGGRAGNTVAISHLLTAEAAIDLGEGLGAFIVEALRPFAALLDTLYAAVPGHSAGEPIDGLCDQLRSLRGGKSEGVPNLHKPLMVLSVLGETVHGGQRLIPFATVEEVFRELMLTCGVRSLSADAAAYPFWRLQHDGDFWQVSPQLGVAQPTAAALRQHNVRAGFTEVYYGAIQSTESLAKVADCVLDRYVPVAARGMIRESLGVMDSADR